MVEKLPALDERKHATQPARRVDYSLQALLWIVWTLAVVAAAGWTWYVDWSAHKPMHTIAMVVHCVTVGAIGLVVITIIEQRLEPWRFLE